MRAKGRKKHGIGLVTETTARNRTGKRRWLGEFLRRPAAVSLGLLAATLATSTGCHRQYYRKQADMEAHALIDEKVQDSCQQPGKPIRVIPDQRSRMFNPFDLDFQPMPVDDPASHQYMHKVDGRRGYPMWHAAGTTNATENPHWWEFLPLDENGVLKLNADTAVQLAYLHSPEYQRQIEQLYLSALDVSSERFRFSTQFFGGMSSFFTGRNNQRLDYNPVTGTYTRRDGSSSDVDFGPFGARNFWFQRSFATGGELLVGFANSFMWQFSGENSQSANPVVDFTFVQPLLRGAGRDRVLERLTLSERRLLANIRAFERYRRSFYLSVTIGRATESTVQRSGGVFGVGLAGFTGLGSGFSGLSGGGGGGSGFGVAGGAGVPQAGGFLGLLQSKLQISNLEENLARLEENLLILEDTLVELLTTIPEDSEAIPRQRLQIAQARSALLNAQTQLISRRADYNNDIDRFVRGLGLPPYLCVEIEDPMLDRFELIDKTLRGRREQLIDLRTVAGQTNLKMLELAKRKIDPETGLPSMTIEWSPKLAEIISALKASLGPLADFRKQVVETDLPRVTQDLARLKESQDARRRQSQSLRQTYEQNRGTICNLLDFDGVNQELFAGDKIQGVVEDIEGDYQKVTQRFKRYDQLLTKLGQELDKLSGGQAPAKKDGDDLAETIRNEIILASQDILTDLSDDVLALQLIQARCRTESATLPEIDLTPGEAFQIAQANRRDWANARASLVDAWRLIEFNADDLESTLNVVFSGELGHFSSNPWNEYSSNSQLRAGLRWDAPLTRLQERNTYRQSLIDFDQARRTYYQYEDGIWQLLRGQLRQVLTNQINFELGRQAVGIAAEQLELNEDLRQLRDARGLSSGPTAAADTIRALSDLLNSQNTLLNLYVNYEVIRRSIDFDLDTMQLTPDGLWIDPGAITPETLGGGDWQNASHVNGCKVECYPAAGLLHTSGPLTADPTLFGDPNGTILPAEEMSLSDQPDFAPPPGANLEMIPPGESAPVPEGPTPVNPQDYFPLPQPAPQVPAPQVPANPLPAPQAVIPQPPSAVPLIRQPAGN
jgi:hypothetical protein